MDSMLPSGQRSKGRCLLVVVGICIAIALIVGLSVGLTRSGGGGEIPDAGVPAARRVNCAPEVSGPGMSGTVSAEACARRGCVYAPAKEPEVPACFINPTNGSGYRLEHTTQSTSGSPVTSYMLEAVGKGLYDPPIPRIEVKVSELGNDLLRIRIDDADATSSRYEVPWSLTTPPEGADDARFAFVVVSEEPFTFEVIRRSTNKTIFDTSVGGLVFSDRFLQLATALPSTNVYGFGENVHTQLRHDVNYRRWPIFARDQPLGHHGPEENLYSAHPFYECVEDSEGNTHGVLLYNSNAMEYELTPEPMLVFRTIGGILDFYIFMGPSPEEVIQQYTAAIGRPYMPPLWALGFQLSRYGYENSSELVAAVDRTLEAGIPLDVVHWDIDYMDRQRDFTIDPLHYADMPDRVQQLYHQHGIRSIVILDPALEVNDTYGPYTDGHLVDAFIKWESRDVMPPADFEETNSMEMLGFVWPEYKTVFPDFFLPQTAPFWNKWLKDLHEIVKYHGLWLDMNEPANFGTNEEKPWNFPSDLEPWSLKCPEDNYWDDPPYGTKAAYYYNQKRLSDKTICMQAKQGLSGKYRHYDVHNLFGHQQIIVSLTGMRNVFSADPKRGMILTRSSFVGTGKYAGRWLGDNTASWEHLRDSIIGMLEFNLFGMPYVGSDICGYFGDTTVELCKRWMQLGAFYPFARNHNGRGNKHQDPGALGEEVAKASRHALATRYELLPYLYTLFHQAHTEGGTVARPIFHEFPRDAETLGVWDQFLWGPALMICPIVHEGRSDRQCYIPEGRWFDYYNGVEVAKEEGQGGTVTAAFADVPLYLRGGHVIPTQVTGHNNTMDSFTQDFVFKAALDASGMAVGFLFWDNGESVDTFETEHYFYAGFVCNVTERTFTYTVTHNDCGDCGDSMIASLQLIGVTSQVARMELSVGSGAWVNVAHTQQGQYVNVDLEAVDPRVEMTQDFIVRWS